MWTIAMSRPRSVIEGLCERCIPPVPRLVAAIGVAATIVACGEQAATDPLLDSPLAILYGGWNGDDGAIEGRLELRGSCLYVSPPAGGLSRGGPAYLVFARDGLDWDATTQVVRIGSDDFAVGQNVRFGGSFMSSAPSFSGVRWLNPPAQECDTSRVWFVGR